MTLGGQPPVMGVSEYTRRLLGGRSDSSILYECRHCGTSRYAPMRRCPACDSHDIITYDLD